MSLSPLAHTGSNGLSADRCNQSLITDNVHVTDIVSFMNDKLHLLESFLYD